MTEKTLINSIKFSSAADYNKIKDVAKHYENCDFSGIALNRAIFKAQFRRCEFIGTKLRSASFKEAIFINCNFNRAQFNFSDFKSCRFFNCSFRGATMTYAVGLKSCFFDKTCKYLYEVGGVQVSRSIDSPSFSVRARSDYATKRSEQYSENCNKPKKEEEEKITDLPPVNHYRSTPSKDVKVPDKEYYAGWAAAYGYMGNLGDDYMEEKNFGYGENAVLECPDINEFLSC